MATEVNAPILVPTAEAARFLGISRSTLEKWRFFRNPDSPPVVNFGRSIRYKITDLEAWAERHRSY